MRVPAGIQNIGQVKCKQVGECEWFFLLHFVIVEIGT